jgi:hypothetical protein
MRVLVGFKLALELSIKATLALRKLAEMPITGPDRTVIESKVRLSRWLLRTGTGASRPYKGCSHGASSDKFRLGACRSQPIQQR